MIRKYLIIGNQLMLSSVKPEDDVATTERIIDLQLSIHVYWELVELLKKADFLLASGEHQTDVEVLYKGVFSKTAPFAIFESDRQWLYEKADVEEPSHNVG